MLISDIELIVSKNKNAISTPFTILLHEPVGKKRANSNLCMYVFYSLNYVNLHKDLTGTS